MSHRPPGIFITDFDGTLRTSSGFIAEEDLETLQSLGESGYIRAVATGRSLYSLKKSVDETLPIDYVIFSSGAGVLDFRNQRIMRAANLETEEVRRSANLLLELEKDFMIHEPIPDNHCFLYHSTGRANPDFARRCELYREHCRPFCGDTDALGAGAQLLAIEPSDGQRKTTRRDAGATIKELRERLPACSIIRTTSPLDGRSVWIEIFPAEVSKGQTTAWLANQFGLGPESSMVVGNDFNDEDLLDWSRHAYVVANAAAELRERFSVVSSNDECGVTEAVRRWLKKD
jgi:hydroxymethylpyrimidine pyrophosphatase-like HAD family hydrolase